MCHSLMSEGMAHFVLYRQSANRNHFDPFKMEQSKLQYIGNNKDKMFETKKTPVKQKNTG